MTDNPNTPATGEMLCFPGGYSNALTRKNWILTAVVAAGLCLAAFCCAAFRYSA